MTEPTLVFVDTETTGLDPDRHEVWEVATITRSPDGSQAERVWQLPVDLSKADPAALRIGRFHERRWGPARDPHSLYANQEGEKQRDEAVLAKERYVVDPFDMERWAAFFSALIPPGAHLVGAVVSFDEERLRRLLRRNGQCPMWHYHIIDVEALAVGWLRGRLDADDERLALARPPWMSDDLSRHVVGVEPDAFDKHTALGDARWAMAVYDAVMSGRA